MLFNCFLCFQPCSGVFNHQFEGKCLICSCVVRICFCSNLIDNFLFHYKRQAADKKPGTRHVNVNFLSGLSSEVSRNIWQQRHKSFYAKPDLGLKLNFLFKCFTRTELTTHCFKVSQMEKLNLLCFLCAGFKLKHKILMF